MINLRSIERITFALRSAKVAFLHAFALRKPTLVGRTLFASTIIVAVTATSAPADRPNILIAISDDQSYPHASAYGDPAVKTPAFDRVAREGILFHNAFTPAPGCSPMRAAFLTGREIWQNREAGTHASSFPTDLPVFTDQLAAAGYHVGMTGKGWGPGRATGWKQNPAGKSYSGGNNREKAPSGISNRDYANAFEQFLEAGNDDQPFCFWYGGHEPHRAYERGIGKKNGIDPAKVRVPAFLPDCDVVRNDIADYLFEIQWFDSHLMRMLDKLAAIGELDNTLVIVTSDNGMPFPRAKANLYEYGIHMPLAISWPKQIRAGEQTDDLISLIDVTRTIFDASTVVPKQSNQMPGQSLLPRYDTDATNDTPPREAVFSGRERHSSSRYNTLGYPCRCIRTASHLYIRNFAPERWPAGAPQKYDQATYSKEGKIAKFKLSGPHAAYPDIDGGPTLAWMTAHHDDPKVKPFLSAAVDRRPFEELYDIRNDPACLNNLATDRDNTSIRTDLEKRLADYLTQTGDLRQTDPQAAWVWETYPRYSPLRWFPKPDWAKDANQEPLQWLEQRRPRSSEH